jgi:arylsulfatase A-like enzyme
MHRSLRLPHRRALLVAALTATALVACSQPDPESVVVEPRNVILITLDTQRADFMSAYGFAEKTTPHMDALAEDGTRFDLAISTASVTPVSHAAILSGRFNRDHGLRVMSAAGGYRLPAEVPTLASVLKENGYHTGAVHSAFPVSSHFGFARGFDSFKGVEGDMEVDKGDDGGHSWNVHQLQRRSDDTTDLALRFVKKTKGPFFLWIHYWDPHDWLKIPPKEHAPPHHKLKRVVDGKEEWIRPNKDLYKAEIKYQDLQFGRLVEHLKKTGLYRNTVLAVVSDHGEGLGDHGWGGHRLLYQEQIRVPLIVRVPGHDQLPDVGELVRSVDIFPTVLDYLGIEHDEPVSGRSLRPLMEGAEDRPRLAFAEQINAYDFNANMVSRRPLDDFLYLAMDRDWKLVWRPTHPEASELYHISADPLETANHYRPDHPEAIRLGKALAWHSPWVHEPFAPLDDPGNLEAAMEALSGLGYTSSEGIDPTDIEWAWTCPDHRDTLLDEQVRCTECQSAPLLIGRGPVQQ